MDVLFETRLARTEQFFHVLNDHVAALDPGDRGSDSIVRVVCECSQVDCVEPVDIPRRAFRAVHQDEQLAIVHPGHCIVEEAVRERGDGYWIIHRQASPALAAPEPGDGSAADVEIVVAAVRTIVEQRLHVRAQEARVDAHLAVLRQQIAQARGAAHAYHRATYRYTSLMRHRIANPLTVICGMAQTLRDQQVGRARREQMLDMIIDQAHKIEHVAVDPRALDAMEQPLDPWADGAEEGW